MRPSVSDRIILAALGLLALSSLGLKAAAGPPRDGLMDVPASDLERQVSNGLETQHFTVSLEHYDHRSTLILGVRGACRVGARDAREGAARETLFARDAASIGPVRYLYRGRGYDHPPAFAMRLGRLETETLRRLGIQANAPMPVAFAASPECGAVDFGLADVRV